MTQFVFQQGSANGGSGTFLSPWNQAAFNAAIANGSFRVGGADELIIIAGGTETVSISPTNVSGTVFSNGGAAAPQITISESILTNSVSVNLGGVGTGIVLTNTYFSVAVGSSLTASAALLNGKAITGYGTVTVQNLASSLAANLSGISTAVFSVPVALTGNVTFTGQLGRGALNLTGSGVFTVNSTGLQSATTTVGSGVTLRSTAGSLLQLSGASISTTGTGSIVLADLAAGGASRNLSGLTGNVTASVTSNQTFQGNLGTVAVTVVNGVTLTIAAAAETNFANASINGEGAVAYTAAGNNSNETANVLTTGGNALDFAAKTAGGYVVANTGSGTDTITSGLTTDSITSGAGNDRIVLTVAAGGGAGSNDVIRAGSGNDVITVVTAAGALTNTGNNYIESGGGDDIVTLIVDAGGGNTATATGNNYITDFGGADSITGGTGSDTILSGDSNDTVIGGNGADSIGAGSGNDTISGGAGNDSVIGGGGNDSIYGGAGDDSLSGGAGDDTFQFENGEFVAGDSVDGGTGINTITYLASVAGNAQTVVDAAFAAKSFVQTFSLAATSGANSITFGTNAQAAGINSVVGGTGTDTLNASAMSASVVIVGGTGADTITGTAAADSLSGGDGNDTFNFGDGRFVAAETVSGGLDTNVIKLTANSQTIADAAFANKSLTQTFTTADGTNSVTFGVNAQASGITSITGGDGADTLNASAFNVATTIKGGLESDVITAGTNNDQITGGNAADTLTGGTGTDTFIYGGTGGSALASAGNNGADSIADFNAGAGNDIAAFSTAVTGGTALTGAIASLGAVLTANPGGATNVAVNTVSRLVDITGGNDITNAAGLQAALNAGGEYSNLDAAGAGQYIFITAAAAGSSTVNVFFADAAGAGNFANVTSLGTMALATGQSISSFVANNFA
jgi:hypothetical protein